MPQSILQQRLVVVEPLDGELCGMVIFLEESRGQVPRFVELLDEAKHLVDLIGHNVSVLVDLIF